MEEKRKRGRPRTFERERTIALAMENYWQDGLHALSVNEVCRRAGLSKPSLYRQFGGEDGLLDAVLEHYCETVLGPAASHLSPERSFRDNVEGLISFMTAPRESPLGCLHVKMRSACKRLGPRSEARVDAVVQELRATYAAMVRGAQARGEVRADVSPRLAAEYIDAQVTAALHQVAAGEDLEDVRDRARLAFSALLPR
ncbi:MAG: TetR/AcrR family transcriptional regulator [Planctomycetota bacterium]|nr:MAG: TetR/AcrR family transcriptional regulator [Planctomycetota bacterium]